MRTTEKLVAALLVLVFTPAVIALARVWLAVDYASHGFLVPFVALWIAQRDGARLPPPDAPRTPGGLAVIGAALALYAAGLALGGTGLQGLSLVGAIAGGALYLLGRERIRSVAFPIAFLLFMVPLPSGWVTPVILELQLLVSATAVDLLHATGATIAREGNVILLAGGDSLFVDEACSGITSIVTLTPLGIVLAYFTQRGLARRAALALAVVPAAMLANLLRVVITVSAAERIGVARATGNVLHEIAGLLTFALACLALIAFGALLRWPRAHPA